MSFAVGQIVRFKNSYDVSDWARGLRIKLLREARPGHWDAELLDPIREVYACHVEVGYVWGAVDENIFEPVYVGLNRRKQHV